MSGPNGSSNGYDAGGLSQPHMPHHMASMDSVSTHEQQSPTYGQSCAWGQSPVDSDFGNYSYQHGQGQQAVAGNLSSPRTVWQAAAQGQITPSYATSPSLTSASFDPYPSDSTIVAPNSTIIPPEYTNSPCENPSSCDIDMPAMEVSHYSSPAHNGLDQMDGISCMDRQTSPAYTDDGLMGALSEMEPSVSPSAQGGGAPMQRQGPKPGKSYAQLLYDCFMSHSDHSMTLQEIYKWFRDNTDKAKDDSGKGWQNSVRHNLSMNKAFVKKERHPDGSESTSPGSLSMAADNKKPSNVWVLTEWAAREGVQSTTRYRNQKHTSGNKTLSSRGGGPLRNHGKRAVRDLAAYGTRRISRCANYPQVYATGPDNHMGYYHPQYQQYPVPRQPGLQVMYRTSPNMGGYHIDQSGHGNGPMQQLADVALMAQGNHGLPQQHQQHQHTPAHQQQAVGPTSNPMAQPPTPTRSDDEPRTPNSLPDGLPLPEAMGGQVCNYPDPVVEAYSNISVVSGVSEKDDRLWLDPMDYASAANNTPQVGRPWQMS
ncbi:Forkhead box protein K2 [Zalerion maritima]|uniref:Forkhead box protein K2 n=1 Tax=Zalerion maritima TaxID=339359 RepID=A0AAD5RRY9_9PEZI|nr:Forkhead box protein K2 [Zalerion maritima]